MVTDLKSITDVIGDGLHGTPEYDNNGQFFFINGNNLNETIEIKSDTKRVNEEEYNKYKKPLNSNTILLSINGTLGNFARYNNEPVILGKSACYINIKQGYNVDYISWFLKSKVKTDFERNATGTTIKNISLKQIRDFQIYLPDDVVQEKIAKTLNSIQGKIDVNNKINRNLMDQLNSLYKSWFIDFSPFGGEVPIEWKIGVLKDILELKKDAIKAGENSELSYLPIDSIPMNDLSVSEVKPNFDAQSSLITFRKNDILIGAMRVYFHRVVIAPFDGITRTTCFVLRPYDEEYLGFGLLCCNQNSSIDFAQATSKGSTMPYAVWDKGLGDMEINIPETKTAIDFNVIVKPMLEIIQMSYFENQRLREIRDSLLPKLMSGELDVSDLDI